jgi:hypothetical protein
MSRLWRCWDGWRNPSRGLRTEYVAPNGAVNSVGFGFLQRCHAYGVVGTVAGTNLSLCVQKMSPRTGLKILLGSIFYKDFAPTGLPGNIVVGTDGGIHLGVFVRNMSPLTGL